LRIARRRGIAKARVAVILHRIWLDGIEFRWSNAPQTA